MTEDRDAWAARTMSRVVDNGYRELQVGEVGGRVVLGARRADFRFRWVFTQLHTFVLVHELDVVTADVLREVASASTEYAVRHKGGLPRVLGSGVAVLPVLVCATADDSAVDLVRQRPAAQFGAFTIPVVVELDRGRFTTFSRPRLWGAVYQDFLGEQQRLVAGGLTGEVLPPGGERRVALMMFVVGVVVPAALVVMVVALGLAVR